MNGSLLMMAGRSEKTLVFCGILEGYRTEKQFAFLKRVSSNRFPIILKTHNLPVQPEEPLRHYEISHAPVISIELIVATQADIRNPPSTRKPTFSNLSPKNYNSSEVFASCKRSRQY
jgi:hypothetical protein